MSRTTGYLDPAPVLELCAGRGITSQRTIAEACGESRRTVCRWRNGHTRILGCGVADRIANRLGLHPSELW